MLVIKDCALEVSSLSFYKKKNSVLQNIYIFHCKVESNYVQYAIFQAGKVQQGLGGHLNLLSLLHMGVKNLHPGLLWSVLPSPLPGPASKAACALLVIHPLVVVISLVISYNNPRLHREMSVSISRGGAAGTMQEETFLLLQHQSHKNSICLFFSLYILHLITTVFTLAPKENT